VLPINRPPPPLVLGLLGGVGSGKSTVAGLLGELGAAVLDADAVAREVLDDPDVIAAIRDRLGPAVAPDGARVDRAVLARGVFGTDGPGIRRWLEALTHPRVRTRLEDALAALRASPAAPWLVVLDVPLLIEGPCASWCDRLLFIDAPAAARESRTVSQRGWEPTEFGRREAAQAALDEKRGRADLVLVNDGSLADLRQRVLAVAKQLRDFTSDTAPRMEEAERGPPPHRGD
jgi:dephospho-CoA kinase